MEKQKSNEPTDKKLSNNRAVELTDSLVETINKLNNQPNPDTELTYNQQIKEKEASLTRLKKEPMANPLNSKSEPALTVSKSEEPSISEEISIKQQPIKDGQTSQENKKSQVKKKSNNFLSSSFKTRLNRAHRRRHPIKMRRNLSKRSKSKSDDTNKRDIRLMQCKHGNRHQKSTTAGSDDELSNNQIDYSSSTLYSTSKSKVDPFRYKTLGQNREKKRKTKKQDQDLEEIFKRSTIRNGKFKFRKCNFTLNFL